MLAALAAAGGTAVVQAVVSDGWTVFRDKVAGWFGRGDEGQERAELRRLDRTADAVACAGGDQGVLDRQADSWRTRFEDLLLDLDDTEQAGAAAELKALLDEHSAGAGASAENGSVAGGRDVNINATDRSIAAGVIHGNATLHHPPRPIPPQG